MSTVMVLGAQAQTPKSQAHDIQFLWALGGLTGPPSARRLDKITEEVMLSTGDELKMFVSMLKPAFLYLVHEDTVGMFSMLFPETVSGLAHPTIGAHYIPPSQEWFELDAMTGIERVYLVVSSTRLATLEKLLGELAAAPATRSPALGPAIVNELARLQKGLAPSAWSERPITIAGQVRGDRPDVAQLAVEISAPEYFSRVVIVDHH